MFFPVLINESVEHSNIQSPVLKQTAHSNAQCSFSNELSIPMSRAYCRTRSIVESAGLVNTRIPSANLLCVLYGEAGCFTLFVFLVCLVIVIVLWLLLAVPWVGLQCVIVIFPDHTNLLLLYLMLDTG